MSSKVYVIAEAASGHDGSLSNALDMVSNAAAHGADAVKFQYWGNADRLADRRKVGPEYREIYRRYQMPRFWLQELAQASDEAGIDFMCTTYLPEDIEIAAPYVKLFKVSSFEAGDREFLLAHGDRPVILSTGMMSLTDAIQSASRLFRCHGVLHCVSSYPAGQVDLAVIDRLRRAVPGFVGLSDHTANNLTGALATAAGAEILEVHFRHPQTSKDNPDYAVAVPNLGEYVRLVRFAEAYRGDGIKHMTDEEKPMSRYRTYVES